MKKQFALISDSSCDLPQELAKEKEVRVVPFYVTFDGEQYFKEGVEMSGEEFYERAIGDPKTIPKTSMPSIQDFADAFIPFVKNGEKVVCICISTKFSGSYDSARNARELVLEEYPDACIAVIDARVNTVLQADYVLEAVRLRDQGISPEESVERLLEIRDSGRIFFTVGNLDYLIAGGRIGKVASVAGSVLGLRPVITLKEGEIFASGVGRSRRSTLSKCAELLVKYVKENNAVPGEWVLDIGYGADHEEALQFREQIVTALHEAGFMIRPEDIPIFRIGAAIAVHTGPYALGVTILKKAV